METYNFRELEILLSQTNTEPPHKAHIPDLARRKLHFDYLQQWASKAQPEIRDFSWDTEPYPDDWQEIARWDAFPDMPTFETISHRLQIRKFVSRALQIASPILAFLFIYSSILESWKSGIVRLLEGLPDLAETAMIIESWKPGIVSAVVLWIVLALSTNKALKLVLSKRATRLWNWEDYNYVLDSEGKEALSDPSTFTPKRIYWQPYTNQLIVSRDHERFNIWSIEIAQDVSEVKRQYQTED